MNFSFVSNSVNYTYVHAFNKMIKKHIQLRMRTNDDEIQKFRDQTLINKCQMETEY